MKRILLLLLTVLLLACVPTPEQEYVVNKSDDVLEEKLHATPIPSSEDTVDAVPSEVSEPDAPQSGKNRTMFTSGARATLSAHGPRTIPAKSPAGRPSANSTAIRRFWDLATSTATGRRTCFSATPTALSDASSQAEKRPAGTTSQVWGMSGRSWQSAT